MWKVPLSDIRFDSEESNAVLNVLESGWLTMGSVTQQFEEDVKAYVGVKNAVAVSNATAALHLACLIAGVGPGDEVILPALTFVATANAVRYTGATPVFADIEGEDSLNISPSSIEAKITEQTKAIIVVHYGGYACDMHAIMQIAQRNNLLVIEDAAHAIGSSLDGRMLGTWGQTGCFSFFSNKNMTTGEGGMIITNDDAAAERLRHLRSHGMTTLTWDRHKGHAWTYDVVGLGYNYRIDEIRSSLGIVQLSKLNYYNEKRRSLTNFYREQLRRLIPEIGLPFLNHPGLSACHLFPVLLPDTVDRKKTMDGMKANGIQTSIHYPPIHHFAAYRSTETQETLLPVTEKIANRELTLPLYPAMSKDDVKLVVQSLQTSLHPA